MEQTASPDGAAFAAGQSRGERKERTRQAILAAALELADESSLSAVSLRQVARKAGVVPTAFYRHFSSLEDVGLQLVDDSLDSLRGLLRDVRRRGPDFREIIDGSVRVLAEHVHRQEAHFGFIARERVAGPPAVREAIRHGIQLSERELATDLARMPGTDTWEAEDLRTLSNLIVTLMVFTAEQIIAGNGRPATEERVMATARTQLRMVLVGGLHWESGRGPG